MATKKTQTAKTAVKEEAKKATQTVKETAEKVEKSAKMLLSRKIRIG